MPITFLKALFTFFTVLPFVARIADAGSDNAGAVVAAGHVNALVCRDVTLGAFPAAVAETSSLHVLSVTAAQHGAGCWGHIIKERKKPMLQYRGP